MTLREALGTLAGVHLRAMEFDDWHVEMGAVPDAPWDAERYVPAWAVVRAFLLSEASEE